MSKSSAGGSRVKTSARPAEAMASAVLEAAFGSRCSESSRAADPSTSPSKTSLPCGVEEWTKSSKALPHAGMMRSGSLYKLTISGLRTAGKGCSLWPTSLTTDAKEAGGRAGRQSHGGQSLTDAVRLWIERWRVVGAWPTPASSNFNHTETVDSWLRRKAEGETQGHRNGLVLGIAVQIWYSHLAPLMPTVGPGGSNKAVLHPPFVEALMGFPRGHVTRSLQPSEMPLFRDAPKSQDT